MRLPRNNTYLTAALSFAILTAAFLLLVGYLTSESRTGQVLAILSGMTAMGALSAFQRYLEEGHKPAIIHISFNETFLSASISEASQRIAHYDEIKGRQPLPKHEPWEVTASDLVGLDNALALAKLRMDIESELRRIALESEIEFPERFFGVTGLARELIKREVVPAEFLQPLKEVIDACNRGVHGEVLPPELPASVVRIGNQLIERLHLLPQPTFDNQSEFIAAS